MQRKFRRLTLASAMAALTVGLPAAERASAAGTGTLSAQPLAVAQATVTDNKASDKKQSKPAAATKSSTEKKPAGEKTTAPAAPAAPPAAAATPTAPAPAPAAAVAVPAAAAAAATTVAAAPAQPNPAEALALGKKLAMDRASGNCIACHMIPGGESPGTIGPPLVAMQVRYPNKDALRGQIWDATKANPASSMPPFGKNQILTEQQINQIVEFVWSL